MRGPREVENAQPAAEGEDQEGGKGAKGRKVYAVAGKIQDGWCMVRQAGGRHACIGMDGDGDRIRDGSEIETEKEQMTS